jgi:hypothetical protein
MARPSKSPEAQDRFVRLVHEHTDERSCRAAGDLPPCAEGRRHD